jgi:hypothetical protein
MSSLDRGEYGFGLRRIIGLAILCVRPAQCEFSLAFQKSQKSWCWSSVCENPSYVCCAGLYHPSQNWASVMAGLPQSFRGALEGLLGLSMYPQGDAHCTSHEFKHHVISYN